MRREEGGACLYEFPVGTVKVRAPQNLDHRPPPDNTIVTTNGARRQDITEDRGGGGAVGVVRGEGEKQKYIMLYQRHSFQRVAAMERRVSPLSTNAHRLALLSRATEWCAAYRAPSGADPFNEYRG